MDGLLILAGAAASLLTQGIKKLAEVTGFSAALLSVVSALGIAACYSFLVDTGMWASLLPILSVSQLVYNFLLKPTSK